MKKSRKQLNHYDPEVIAAIVERIRNTPREELIARMEYRKPGIEETDMTGHFPIIRWAEVEAAEKEANAKAKAEKAKAQEEQAA